ncbi:hypothetical protein [Pleomorphomonas sp. NRK KF1]|uniref:hypothetical protein n=1 Tax=Pleomorphomonas sp. NRK KF1 TaxID=2943000 RepID=UPI002044B24F|nr:hypothetical protein [Pleomorphomonas sp. NRK KF1]MCM5554113.1 hypothetical protein [Pleomorphomonas sp. NRK KF1]
MGNNLHVSYDLMDPGQNYDKVIDKIKSLGEWAKIHKSFWYVNSSYTAAEAVNIVWSAMDVNDKLYIFDAKNNSAAWENLSDEVAEFIKNRWLK